MTLSVAALASCSNDETLDTNRSAISFRSLVEGMARGTSVTVANLDQFKVTAVGNGKVYMDKVAVNGSESGAKWATEGTYYWPAFQLDFYGYAPADAQGVTLNETTRTIADFTPAQKVEEQKDLVIACNTGTKESNQETGVPMNFRHALSQVVVKAKCPAENMKVEVIGIKVANSMPTPSRPLPGPAKWTPRRRSVPCRSVRTTSTTPSVCRHTPTPATGATTVRPTTCTTWQSPRPAKSGLPPTPTTGPGHHLVCRPPGDHQGGECGHRAEGRTRAGHLVVAHLGDFCRRGADHPREDVPCKGSIRACLRVHAGQPRLVRDGRSGVPRASMCRPSRHSPAVRS